jgi:hypothetical protein
MIGICPGGLFSISANGTHPRTTREYPSESSKLMESLLDTILSSIFAREWRIFVVVSVLLLGATELGFRLGLRLYREKDDPRIGQISGTQAAMLTLLGLLLGFTFALAEGRFETRRGLVIQEANAIGTTYLRASFLPEAHKQSVEKLLRRYVDVRLDFYYAGEDQAKIDAAEKAAAQIHRELWAHAAAVGQATPTPLVATFVSTLNDTIDLDATRLNALRAHVPGAVWLLVLVVAVCGTFTTGLGAGASGERSAFANVLMPLLIAVAMMLIADLDRPRAGLILIDQQPLLNLKQSLQPGQP